MNIQSQIEKKFIEKFCFEHDHELHWASDHGPVPWDVIDFITSLLQSTISEEAKEICKIIDDIELSHKNTSMEEWKMFKRIRNTIRDKYDLSLKKGING